MASLTMGFRLKPNMHQRILYFLDPQQTTHREEYKAMLPKLGVKKQVWYSSLPMTQ